MIALTFPRGSSQATTCQFIFIFILFSTFFNITYTHDSTNIHEAILIGRQDDPGWVEGDGDDTTPTTTDDWQDPTTTDDWQDPTTTDDWQDPTTTDDWQDPTTTDDWQDPTTTDDWQDPTTTDDWQDPTTTDDWQDPTTTDNWQDPTTTDDWQEPTTTDDWQEPATTDDWEDTTTTTDYVEESTEAIATLPATTTEKPVTTEAPTTRVEPSSSVEEQQPTTSFSVTSSSATPSLVLGSNECADDPNAVNNKCPNDYFCNAATKQCNALSDNGGQCYEDFQCKSGFCTNGTCTSEPSKEGANLSGSQIAGITIGSVAGAVIIVFALMWCQKRRSRQVSTRARKFEQIRTEDEDLEADDVMRDTGHRASKYNLLTSLMTGTAVGRSLSRMGQNNSSNRSMNSQAYLSHSPQPAMSGRSMPNSSSGTNGAKVSASAGAVGGAAIAGAVAGGAVYNHYNDRQSKVDPNMYDDQQYYGNMAPSSPTYNTASNHNDEQSAFALSQTQQQLQQQFHDPYRMSQASAIDPFGATAYNNATQHSSSVERPATTVLRESTFNNLHAPIFHVSAPQDDNTVAAGGGAFVPTVAPSLDNQPRQSPEMDAFGANGGGKRGSWLLKEIAARWQQGSATGARASGVTATSTDTSGSQLENNNSNNNNNNSTNLNVDEPKQPMPQTDNTMTGGLWDDGLASAGGSSVTRSASTASTNPFRNSVSNPRDSFISALRIPPIHEDAWTSEDHISLSSDDNRTVTKENYKDTSAVASSTIQQEKK